jgi:hypothetical protein
LEGIGYLIRQLWVVLTEQLRPAHSANSQGWIAELTLQRLIEWLFRELSQLHPEELSISLS